MREAMEAIQHAVTTAHGLTLAFSLATVVYILAYAADRRASR